jgi:predicted ATPase/class 3 adenylate cyclase
VGAPSGTVTFLFTDVEGSTRLWERDPAAMRAALERHDKVVRDAIEAYGGAVFATGGDGFAAAFTRAGDAVAAAVDSQASLRRLDTPAPIRVRMGVHTGEAVERDGDYFGPAVNRAARLMAAGHGGQVLCSGVTAALVADQLPSGSALVDLGTHRLRDLASPEHVHQVVAAGTVEAFPPLRSLDAFPGNLPAQATAFVGREREVEELAAAVKDARVVTLTGVGGVGKTRLALQAAAEVLPSFRDGAWLVELAGVGSPDDVHDAVITALGLASGPTGSAGGAVGEQLRPRELLLVIDNCEHLLTQVASMVEDIVRTARDVHVLATSREGLGVAGEHIRTVPSLRLPDSAADVDTIAAVDAVRLFVERAREASDAYRFTDDQATAIADVCRRLDGIPLAIELAAARVPALTPAEIAAHLDRRFKLLTSGRRAAATRHQTLRNAMEWSYQLLDADEQAVLDRLAVFVGGFELPAAQAVAASDDVDAMDVLDILARLVSKSLVVAEPRDGTTRYRLLETVRDFAWEHVQAADEVETLSRRHAAHFAAFAHDAGEGLRSQDEGAWRERVEREVDNLRAALAWAISVGDVELALRPISDLSVLGDGVAPYGLMPEQAARLDEDHPLAALALGSACFAAVLQGESETAIRLAEEAHDRASVLGDTPEALWVRCRVANATCPLFGLRSEGAEEFAQPWITAARALGDPWCLCEVLTFMVGMGQLDTGVGAGEEALLLARRAGAPSRLAFAAVLLAARIVESDPVRAEELLQEASRAAAAGRNAWADYVSSLSMIYLHTARGDRRAAAQTALAAIERSIALRVPGHVLQFVAALGSLLASMGDEEGGLVLVAWAEQRGLVPPPEGSASWVGLAATEVAAARAQRTPAELERYGREAAALNEVAVAGYAREHLAPLPAPS